VPSILFINRVYPPDSGASGRVLEHIARGFAAAGWNVTVLCTTGSREIKGDEMKDGVRIVRIGIAFSKKNLVFRTLGYALMIPSLLLTALRLPRHDIVVTKTDPPMLMILGPTLKYLKEVKTIHWAQDLYPDVAEEVGVLQKGGILSKGLRFLSTTSLRSHDAIISVGRCMTGRLEDRGITPRKIRMIPNIGIEKSIIPNPRFPNAFRERHGLGDAFVIMYSGNMGRAHEFSTILEASLLLQRSGETGILFLFVGEGPSKPRLQKEVLRLGLKNVRFLSSEAEETLSESLASADLHLVTMKPGIEGAVVPSKFYGVLAAGRPCLFVGSEDSEVARVIQELGAGTVIPVGDAYSLSKVILKYHALIALGKYSEINGKSYLETYDSTADFISCANQLCRTPSISLS
jgi:glycosyltransferase involved in cell wall biosynthesis